MNAHVYSVDDLVPGIVVRFKGKPWRVVSVSELPEYDWTDRERDYVEKVAEYRERREGNAPANVFFGHTRLPVPFTLVMSSVDGNFERHTRVWSNGGTNFRRGQVTSPEWHDWDILSDWPRSPVCGECGGLWPCIDQIMETGVDWVIADALRHRCDRCSRTLSGRMSATVYGDPVKMFCGRQGACLNAAKRYASEQGLAWGTGAGFGAWDRIAGDRPRRGG